MWATANPGEDVVAFVNRITMLINNLSAHFVQICQWYVLADVGESEESNHWESYLLFPLNAVYLAGSPQIASVRHTDIKSLGIRTVTVVVILCLFVLVFKPFLDRLLPFGTSATSDVRRRPPPLRSYTSCGDQIEATSVLYLVTEYALQFDVMPWGMPKWCWGVTLLWGNLECIQSV